MTAIEEFQQMYKQYPPEMGKPKPLDWEIVVTKMFLELIQKLER